MVMLRTATFNDIIDDIGAEKTYQYSLSFL